MHPGTPRDIDFPAFLDGLSFKPANSDAKQLAHEVARQLVALFGGYLFDLLPPGRDKSLSFTLLEDLLMRANRALAIGGGPKVGVTAEYLQGLLLDLQALAVQLGALLENDPRIEAYKAEQRGEDASAQPFRPVPVVPDVTFWSAAEAADFLDRVNAEVGRVHPGYGWEPTTEHAPGLPGPGQRPPLTPEKPFTSFVYTKGEEPGPISRLAVKFQEHWADPQVSVEMYAHNEGENFSESVGMDVDDPDVLEEFAAGFLSAANRLRAARAALR